MSARWLRLATVLQLTAGASTSPPPPDDDPGDDVAQSLFERHQKIYPREVHGTFALLRTTSVFVLLGLFYTMCWIPWGDRQAVLFDLPARQFHILGLTLWPQDFLYLTYMLILAAFSLFFFTALAGRLWCGYACPQTVWTETFLWMERWIEGNRLQQMKLDRAPWSWRKLRIKATKQAAWLSFSALTGFTFVAYFVPSDQLLADLVNFNLGPATTFWMVFYGFATYGNAGYMREQVCKYMCPYARFQSAMFDDDTLIISYDAKRGDPRGSRRSGTDARAAGLGDCINCTMCVQVCPTGIDIRDGLQYECIGCSACIDVCNDVMDKMGYEPGLIRYTTENALQGQPTRVLRPRILVYAAILTVLVGLFAWSLFQRVPLGLDVMRDRNQLYREVKGEIENVYTLRIMNMDDARHEFTLAVSGIEGLHMNLDIDRIVVESGSIASVPVGLRVTEDRLSRRSTPIEFELRALDDPRLTMIEDAKFLGPGSL